MSTFRKDNTLIKILIPFVLAVAMIMVIGLAVICPVYAAEEVNVDGKVYEFDKDTDYTFSKQNDYTTSDNADSYGTFSISGIDEKLKKEGSQNGVPAYVVSDGNIQISYTYKDTLLNADKSRWHLISDKEKKLDIYKLDDKIKNGVLMLQCSVDGINWSNILVQTNAFKNIPIRTESLYESQDVELINGCYYRLIVAYKLEKKTGSKKIAHFIPKDTYEYKRIAEVYTFYVARENEYISASDPNTQKYSLGETVKVADFESFSVKKAIKQGDYNYNWNIGNFFVSGFTGKTEKNDTVVFLKNVGDEVTLWFNLQQNIDALNGNTKLTIADDDKASDQEFETDTLDFGRGMLLIRYTDSENVKHQTIMYSNFLEANTSLGTDTRVQLFEEGDYEVALDYGIRKDRLIDKTQHYRIAFKFSVRNANCMVYPFDVKTGEELTNSSLTENGFYLDLAKSKYLNIYIKKENWIDGANGLTEDTRFNTTAKDGDQYTDDGIYTITVQNQYTGQSTTKQIYVGSNPILKAYMTTGYSLSEIKKMVDEGATIYEDGTIEMPEETPLPESDETDDETESTSTDMSKARGEESVESEDISASSTEDDSNAGESDELIESDEKSEAPEEEQSESSSAKVSSGTPVTAIIGVGTVIILAVIVGVTVKMKSKRKE